MASTDLITLDEARQFLQKQTSQVATDDALTALITRASEVIQRYIDVRVVKESSSAKTFDWDGSVRITLAPYVARTVTAVTLDPNEDASALTAGDWRLTPSPAVDGVYYTLLISDLAWEPYAGDFPKRQVQVTGTWGFASVPEPLKHACCVTVAAWYRRDVAAFSTVYNETEGRVERPEALPSAVVRTLETWRRRD